MPSRFGFRTTTDRLYSVSYRPHSHITPSYLTHPHTLHTPTHILISYTLHTTISYHAHLHTPSHHTQVMFKLGDDLRQDQLILQLITLMDRILRRENLDLKLTPYNVLACSSNHGKSNCTFHALWIVLTQWLAAVTISEEIVLNREVSWFWFQGLKCIISGCPD